MWETSSLSLAFQRENWQKKASCLPNMMKLQSLPVCVPMNEWTAYSGLIVTKYDTFIAFLGGKGCMHLGILLMTYVIGLLNVIVLWSAALK